MFKLQFFNLKIGKKKKKFMDFKVNYIIDTKFGMYIKNILNI